MKLISKKDAVAQWKSLKADLKADRIKFDDYIAKKCELKKFIRNVDLS